MNQNSMNQKGQMVIALILDFIIVLTMLGAFSPFILTMYNTILAPNVANLPNSAAILSAIGIGILLLFFTPIFLIVKGLQGQNQQF